MDIHEYCSEEKILLQLFCAQLVTLAPVAPPLYPPLTSTLILFRPQIDYTCYFVLFYIYRASEDACVLRRVQLQCLLHIHEMIVFS